jgi:hypothetical protein
MFMDVVSLIRIAAAVPLCILALLFLVSKFFFLAPTRLGWFMMLANTFYEALFKKYHWKRWPVDAAILAVSAAGWTWVACPYFGVTVGLTMALVWAWTLRVDVQWRTDELARQDSRYGIAAAPKQMPLPIPRLIVIVRGPVLERGPVLDLGHWPEGREDAFDLLVLNPSTVAPQWPMTVRLTASGEGLQVAGDPSGEMKAPNPSDFLSIPFRLRAGRAGTSGKVEVTLTHGDLEIRRVLRLRGVVSRSEARAVGAEIRRWKGGARAGFGWRGDQDLYDPATFQSIEGLRLALGLSRQFRLPSTLYLSGRLSLVPEEHRKFCEHFGFDRRTEGIPGFIEFLKNDVTLEPELEFPFQSPRPLAMELGNHMYLHYGTHAAADDGNQWGWRVEMGKGRYPWQGPAADSFSEQRDNALKNIEVVRETLGVELGSWGVPGRANDADTARALEAAGVAVASDSDASAWTNVMRLVPPHHPAGSRRLVEITKKYPGDSNDAYKIATLKYWLHAARRTGRVFLFMAHHHLLMYEGTSCYQLTREFFRYALAETHGDLYAATVTSLGLYWERVLCPEHRWVRLAVEGESVVVENTGTADLDQLPLEIDLGGGRRFMALVRAAAHEKTTVRVV